MVKTYFVKETGANADKFEVEEKPNDYDFIPIVHIENIPMSDSYGGKSDMEDIVKINKIYNEMAEDVKMIIDYYAQPTTVITGGTAGQLKRGINQIWSGLPSDAQVFNLTLGEDLSASMGFLKMLKDAIHDLSGVPMQLYHPEMRVNSSKFDMNDLTFNFIPGCVDNDGNNTYTSFKTIPQLAVATRLQEYKDLIDACRLS